DIIRGAYNFGDFISGLQSNGQLYPGVNFNVVTHSHGGNVLKLAYAFGLASQPINHLINLGTPENWDFPRLYYPYGNIGSYCLISSYFDPVQFAGSSPYQVGNYGWDLTEIGV